MRLRRNMTALAAAFAIALAGCSAGTTTAASGSTTASSATSSSVTSSSTTSSSSASTGTSTGAATAVAVDASISDLTHFDSDDLVWDANTEIAVTLADNATTLASGASGVTVDGNTVTISAAGTYVLTGSLSDGQIVVAAGEEDVVRIILNGVELTNSTGSPFVVQSANEAIVYLADGSTNTVSDAASYADTGTDAPNAAIYSMADLTIAGSGSLTVNGNFNDGITSKDGLVLASGTVTVKAADDGIVGKDYVALLDGNFTVDAADDGIKSDNAVDATRGWLLVKGGQITVSAGGDGIKAYNTVTISGGTANVTKSNEGIEAEHILLTGGTVTVNSADDGINASDSASTGSGGEQAGDQTIEISGGTITVNAEGDGLDSNGSAAISGGTVVVNGPTGSGNGALDVNGELVETGGTVVAAGSSGMAVTPAASSSQSGVQVTLGSALAAGTVVHLVDSSGNVVLTFTTTKAAASLVISFPSIVAGEAYTVSTGGSSDTSAGIGTGSLVGASSIATVTAGQYTAGGRGGGRR